MSILHEAWVESELPSIKIHNDILRDRTVPFASMVRWYFAKRATSEMPINILVQKTSGPIGNYESPSENSVEIFLIEEKNLSYEGRCAVIDKFVSKFLDGFTENERIAGKFNQSNSETSFRGFEDAEHHRSVLVGIGRQYQIANVASRYAMMMIANMVPWYPRIEQDEAQALIKASSGDCDALIELIQKFEEELRLPDKKYRALLNEAFKEISERKVKSTLREIDMCSDSLHDLQRQYAERYKNFLNLSAALEGYKIAAKKRKNADELIEFVNNTPGVRFDELDGHQLSIIVDGEARQWDQDFLEDELFDNEDCFLWDSRHTSDMDSDEQAKWKKLWEDLFVNQTVKLMLTARYTIDLDEGTVSAGSAATPNHLSNPHTAHYGCMGQNETTITQHIAQGDVIYAIQCAIGITAQINFHDSVVMENFCGDLLDTDIPCLITEDGEILTPSAYMERM